MPFNVLDELFNERKNVDEIIKVNKRKNVAGVKKRNKKVYYIRGAFNKFQDYSLNTRTVNCTFLTVMLLFNIFSLQFTAMFPLFYKSVGSRSIKFFIGTCRNFCTFCCSTFSSFLNLMSPSDLLCGPNKLKLLGAKSGLYGECCSSSQLISSFFELSNG